VLVGVGLIAKNHVNHNATEPTSAHGATSPVANPAAPTASTSAVHPTAASKATSGSGTSTATRVAAPSSFAPPSPWALTFNSSFEGNQLNTQVWGTCYPWSTSGCSNFGNTSDPDQEWYQASQAQVSGGALHLVAERAPTPGLNSQGAAKTYACRSGMVTTYPSLNFKYGYIQITAQIPFGKGLWPALWLAASNKNWPPEVDILEHWASEPAGKVYLHPLSGARQGGDVSMPGLSAGMHTFGLYWTKTQLAWYYDGTQVFTTSVGIPQQDMYLIANLAVDDASPGGCSGSLLITSVKVWQPPN
jgi:beta-glucanase (GH16 family)